MRLYYHFSKGRHVMNSNKFKMKIQLSDHFTYGKLIRFTMPSIAMMIFTSIYSVVDVFFVSNFAGKTPFAAVNLIMPFLMIVATVGVYVWHRWYCPGRKNFWRG